MPGHLPTPSPTATVLSPQACAYLVLPHDASLRAASEVLRIWCPVCSAICSCPYKVDCIPSGSVPT
ncbi:uncharacterized protein LOC142772205 isoform X4 [Rhipicephalus microplus]|uniref:uncharacterized protein LOC142772205 isoform X4 n=1 Tax=Rhipicephalus microplus TaxID=6941 RepID=UPI003F6B136B